MNMTVLFHGLDNSPALEKHIREHAERLRKFAADIVSCKVVVSQDGQRHLQGAQFHVGIRIVVGRLEVDSSDTHTRDPRHEDAYVAVTDAFAAVTRRIHEHAQRRRGSVKRHSPDP